MNPMERAAATHAGAAAPQRAYAGLEAVLVEGLRRMSPRAREIAHQRVLEGCEVDFTVRMGAGAYIACSLVSPDGNRVEIFRIELGSKPDLSALN